MVDLVDVEFDDAVDAALDAILADRLAILCGAGLSMSPPSNIPGSAQIAAAVKEKYDAIYGATRPPLAPDIEDQAEFFFGRGELGTIFLRRLVDKHTFSAPPNPGHVAIADLLLAKGIQTAVTTNVDSLIEAAAGTLFGELGVGVDEMEMAKLAPTDAPMLKIHGSWTIDRSSTIWAPSQATSEPYASKLAASADWLRHRLADRDLIIVGYYTDWDYLNAVLDRALSLTIPARVIVVDPSSISDLQTKAPVLTAIGKRATSAFWHVTSPGDAFLSALRTAFSLAFIRQVLHGGAAAFVELKGHQPDDMWKEPPALPAETLWQVRRDLEGCRPNAPATMPRPPDEPILGATILQLQNAGAVADGPYWTLAGNRIRVVRTSNQMLDKVIAKFKSETPPVVSPDVSIAVGAEATPLSPHIVRGATTGTAVRPAPTRWMTRAEAVTEFHL